MQIRIAIALALATLGAGWAAGADGGSPEPVVPRLKCRSFPTDPGAEIDTRDPATEIGRWVISLEDRGWEVADVDWEIGQKPTGFPQGYTHVCMEPIPR
jgi:hypothetical protein